MKIEELKQTTYDYLQEKWCECECDIDEESIEMFIREFTNSNDREIYYEIENELNMKNIFDVITFVNESYEEMTGETYSVLNQEKLLIDFIYFVGEAFAIDKFYEYDNLEAPS